MTMLDSSTAPPAAGIAVAPADSALRDDRRGGSPGRYAQLERYATQRASSIATSSGRDADPARRPLENRTSHTRGLRAALVVGCIATGSLAAWFGQPGPYEAFDPELANLLRAMAAIKGAMVVPAIGLLVWRLGIPIPRWMAAAYVSAACMLVASTVFIWQLTLIPTAAVAFHLCGLALVLTAWRDYGDRKGIGD